MKIERRGYFMRKDSTKFILPILVSFFVIIPTVIFVMVQVMNATKFALRSGYAGYELGYQPVILDGKYFCTADTTKPEQAIFDGDLTRSEEYVVDESTHQVTSKDSKLLKKGRYDIEVYTEDQSNRESLLISVFDSLPPVIACEYDLLKIPDTKTDTLSKYIIVNDYDEDVTLNILKEKGILNVIVVDTSGNTTEKQINYVVVKDKKKLTQAPKEEGQKKKVRMIKDKEEYNKVIKEAEELKEKVQSEEENLQKKILKEDFNEYKREEEKKRKEFVKKQETVVPDEPVKVVVEKPEEPNKKKPNKEKEDSSTTTSMEEKPTNTSKPAQKPSNSNNTTTEQKPKPVIQPEKPNSNTTTEQKPIACEIPAGYHLKKDESKVSNPEGYLVKWSESKACGKTVYKPVLQQSPAIFKTPEQARNYQLQQNLNHRLNVEGIGVEDENTIPVREYEGGYLVVHQGLRTRLTGTELSKLQHPDRSNGVEITRRKNDRIVIVVIEIDLELFCSDLAIDPITSMVADQYINSMCYDIYNNTPVFDGNIKLCQTQGFGDKNGKLTPDYYSFHNGTTKISITFYGK